MKKVPGVLQPWAVLALVVAVPRHGGWTFQSSAASTGALLQSYSKRWLHGKTNRLETPAGPRLRVARAFGRDGRRTTANITAHLRLEIGDVEFGNGAAPRRPRGAGVCNATAHRQAHPNLRGWGAGWYRSIPWAVSPCRRRRVGPRVRAAPSANRTGIKRRDQVGLYF